MVKVYRHNKGIAFFVSLALLLLLSISVIVFLIASYNSANISESLIRRYWEKKNQTPASASSPSMK